MKNTLKGSLGLCSAPHCRISRVVYPPLACAIGTVDASVLPDSIGCGVQLKSSAFNPGLRITPSKSRPREARDHLLQCPLRSDIDAVYPNCPALQASVLSIIDTLGAHVTRLRMERKLIKIMDL